MTEKVLYVEFDPTDLAPQDAELCDSMAYWIERKPNFDPKHDALIVAALRHFADCIRASEILVEDICESSSGSSP